MRAPLLFLVLSLVGLAAWFLVFRMPEMVPGETDPEPEPPLTRPPVTLAEGRPTVTAGSAETPSAVDDGREARGAEDTAAPTREPPMPEPLPAFVELPPHLEGAGPAAQRDFVEQLLNHHRAMVTHARGNLAALEAEVGADQPEPADLVAAREAIAEGEAQIVELRAYLDRTAP